MATVLSSVSTFLVIDSRSLRICDVLSLPICPSLSVPFSVPFFDVLSHFFDVLSRDRKYRRWLPNGTEVHIYSWERDRNANWRHSVPQLESMKFQKFLSECIFIFWNQRRKEINKSTSKVALGLLVHLLSIASTILYLSATTTTSLYTSTPSPSTSPSPSASSSPSSSATRDGLWHSLWIQTLQSSTLNLEQLNSWGRVLLNLDLGNWHSPQSDLTFIVNFYTRSLTTVWQAVSEKKKENFERGTEMFAHGTES